MQNNSIKADKFEAIYNILKNLPNENKEILQKAQQYENTLTKPQGSLGELENISAWVSAWRGQFKPNITHPRMAVFAGNHGVTAKGVSAFPMEVTEQMVLNFKGGGASVNQLCQLNDMDLRVYELNLDTPTQDFSEHSAMSEQECVVAINYGMMCVEQSVDFLCLGEMGIGNTTSAAAMAYAMFGEDASLWTGRGTGIEDGAFKNKCDIIDKAVALHKSDIDDYPLHLQPFHILKNLGGFELAAITGAVIAARMARVPVLLDGYACSVAASILYKIDSKLLDHCKVSHLSVEPGHIKLLQKIDKKPLLNLNMRLGEGSGAGVAFSLVKAALACHNGMATFEQAVVSNKS